MDEKKPLRGEISSKIAFTTEVLSKLDQMFNDKATGAISRSVSQATSVFKKLQNDIHREGVEAVSKLIHDGELQRAGQKLKENYDSPQFADIEEILKLSICGAGKDSLKNAINFVDHVNPELKLAAYITIYDEMTCIERLSDVEILLLQSKVNLLDAEEQKMKEFIVKIGIDVTVLAENIVDNFMAGDKPNLSKRVISTCSADTFNTFIPLVIDKFEADVGDLMCLVQFARKMPTVGSSCKVLDETFKRLKEKSLLDSEDGLFLWAYAQELITENEDFTKAEPTDQKIITAVHKELSAFQPQYFSKLWEYVEKIDLHALCIKSKCIKSVMSSFVEWCYAGAKENAMRLIKSAETRFFDTNGRMQKSIYQAMEKHSHLASFEAFKLYHFVQQDTADVRYNQTESHYCRDVEFVRAKVPACLKKVLWNDSKLKFRVINKFYSEALHSEHKTHLVYCSELSRGASQEQIWSISVDKETSLVTFADGANELTFSVRGNVGTPCVRKRGTSWMIKAVDDDYIKIYTITDGIEFFITANPGLEDSCSNKRRLQLTRENSTSRQLWQLEC